VRRTILRIGQIEYANCVPIYAYLQNAYPASDYRYIKGVPSELNSKLFLGQLDVCPSSSIEFAKHPESYLILNDLSISSVGRVKSVYLFSKLPIESLDQQTVGLTGESDTSVNLLKIILRKFYGHRNTYEKLRIPTPDALSDLPAILLIGDSALKAGLHRNSGIYAYDLGELWDNNTGLPFVFALWIAREETVSKKRECVHVLYTKLCEAKHGASGMLTKFAESFNKEWISTDELIAYWKTISYDLTSRHLDGLLAFYRFSAELGLIEAVPPIRFFPGSEYSVKPLSVKNH
jgi:chorismate dehydratase